MKTLNTETKSAISMSATNNGELLLICIDGEISTLTKRDAQAMVKYLLAFVNGEVL